MPGTRRSRIGGGPGHRRYPVPPQFQTVGGGAVTFVTGEVLSSQRDHCTGSTTRACLVSVLG